MANPGLFVKLDEETWERLRAASKEDRRQPGDEAAMLLRGLLVKDDDAALATTASR